MRFTALTHVQLPCEFRRVLPGDTYRDGRQYLPTLMLAPRTRAQVAIPMHTLAIVDRHHVVDLNTVGQEGVAQLVLLLSPFMVQNAPYQQGFCDVGSAAQVPRVYGQVTHVATWEIPQTPLPYQSLYCEFVMDVGGGTVGVRTHVSAPQLADKIGVSTLRVGDWVVVPRPRIDILGFVPTHADTTM